MVLGRKAVFFSLAALLVVGLLFTVYTRTTPLQSSEGISLRIQEVTRDKEFLETVNLPVILRVETKNTLNTMALESIATPYADIPAFQAAFQDCLLNGICPTPAGASPRTLNEVLYETQQRYLNDLEYAEVDLQIITIQLEQIGRWHLQVAGTFRIYLRDAANTSTFESNTVRVTSRLPIEGMIDPLSTRVSGERRYYTRNLVTDWNITTLFAHARRGTFREDPAGPTFLARFTGPPYAPSPSYGTHSIISPDVALPADVSNIDYEAAESIMHPCYIIAYETPLNPPALNIPQSWSIEYAIATSENFIAGYVERNDPTC